MTHMGERCRFRHAHGGKMGKRCVAAGCSNTHKAGVSLFQFPSDKGLRRQWMRQVQRTRAKWNGPSKHSSLCSAHFAPNCFEEMSSVSKTLGLTRKQMLKPTAVPTLFEKAALTSTRPPPPKRRRIAFEKREASRVISAALQEDHKKSNVADSSVVDPPASSEEYDSSNEFEEHASTQEPTIIPPATVSVGTQVQQARCRSVSVQAALLNQDNKMTQVKPYMCDVGVQTDIVSITCDIGVQCSILAAPKCSTPTMDIDSPLEDDPVAQDSDSSDRTSLYTPSDTTSASSESEHENEQTSRHMEKKYLVFESCLLSLFSGCKACGSSKVSCKLVTIGSLLRVIVHCSHCCIPDYTWDSQPYINGFPAGNLMVSSSILFSGALPTKVLRIFQFLNCAMIKKSTFFRIQNKFLFPAINACWKLQQECMMGTLQVEEKALVLGGDGRCDSPGFSAKYGSYCFMELDHNVVLHMELVQSNEVNGSTNMEKEGFIRGMQFFEEYDLPVQTLVTDRHVQLSKWIRENLPEVNHCFDVWHVAKSFRKKVEKLAKIKGCEEIKDWIKSMVNHLYWTAMSTDDSDRQVRLEKWQSLANHVHDKHKGHGLKYKKCEHGKLKKRKWLKYNTKASDKLLSICNDKRFCKDVSMLSNRAQTSSLEAFHSLVNQYAPKQNSFGYFGMLARLRLAALHYNHNANKAWAVTKDGKEQHSILFPKFKKGKYIVRKMKKRSSYAFVNSLMDDVVDIAIGKMKPEIMDSHYIVPQSLCSRYTRPTTKAAAIEEHTSRFTK